MLIGNKKDNPLPLLVAGEQNSFSVGNHQDQRFGKKTKHIFIGLFFLLISFILLWRFIFTPGMPYFNDFVFPYSSTQLTQSAYSTLFTWDKTSLVFGYDAYSSGSGIFYALVFGFLGLLGLSGEIALKVFLLVTLSTCGISAFYFCKFFKRSDLASFIASILFMTTPVIFKWVVEGYLYMIVAYALFPFALIFFIKSVSEKNWVRNCLITAFFLSLSMFPAFLLYIVAFLLYSILQLLFASGNRVRILFVHLKSIVLTFIAFFLVTSYWILPQILRYATPQTTAGLNLGWLWWLSIGSEPLNTIRFLGFPQLAYEQILSGSPVLAICSFVLPILSFFALLASKKDRNTIFFSILFVLSIFLVSGVRGRWVDLTIWVYSNIPYMQIFRGTYKFFLLLSISSLFLVGKSIDLISVFLSTRQHSRKSIAIFKTRENWNRVILTSFLLILVFSQVIVGIQFINENSKFIDLPSEFNKVENLLSSQSEDFKVLWLPADIVLQRDGNNFVNYALFSPKSGAITISTAWAMPNREASGFSQFLLYTIYTGRTNYLGKLLGIAGIKYVVLQENVEPTVWNYFTGKPAAANMRYLLDHQDGLPEVFQEGSLRVYENTYFTPTIHVVNSAVLVTGDRRSLISLTYDNTVNFNDTLLVFANQVLDDSSTGIDKLDNIMVCGGSILDLAFTKFLNNYSVPFWAFASGVYGTDDWTIISDWYFFRNWAYTAAIEKSVISGGKSGGSASLTLPWTASTNGPYEIWAKVFCGDSTGQLEICLDNSSFHVDSKSDTRDYRWIYVGSKGLSSGSHDLQLIGNQGENVMSDLIIAPTDQVKSAVNELYTFLADKTLTYLFEAENLNHVSGWAVEKNFNASNGESLSSLNCAPLSLNASDSFYVPRNENYSFYLRGRAVNLDLANFWQNSSFADWSVPNSNGGNLSLSTINEVCENKSLIFVGNANNNGVVTLKLDPEGTWNWSQHEDGSLEFYVKTDNITGFLRFVMATSSTTYRYWDQEVTSTNWTRIILSLSTGSGNTRSLPDFSSIDYVTVEWQGLQPDFPVNLAVSSELANETANKLAVVVDGTPHLLSLNASSDFEWLPVETVPLLSGWHNFSILASVGSSFYVDAFTIRDSSSKTPSVSSNLSYEVETPAAYAIRLNVTHPVFMVFGESYDPFWIARYNNNLVHPFIGYSYINAYEISDNGQLVISLNFEKQGLRYVGYAVSIISIVIIFSYLSFPTVKKQVTRQRRLS